MPGEHGQGQGQGQGPGQALAAAAPLVVDLDGTLIRSDLLWESLVLFLKRHPLQAWRLPFWLLRGKAGFKESLAGRVEFDPAALPYDEVLLEHIREQRSGGRETVLATGAHMRLAHGVAAHLGLFGRVLATADGVNLTAHAKARRLAELYGAGGYDYIGNSRADLPVWLACRQAYSVTARPFRLADGRVTGHLGARRSGLRGVAGGLLRALRPRQWLKNLLVFTPMLASHTLQLPVLLASLLAFVGFSLCASSAYLLNDALDAQDDRMHPVKRRRPIASGALPLWLGLAASALLAAGGLALSALFDPLLLAAAGVYLAATVTYSLHLKRLLMIDIVALAVLYTLRVLGGGAATGIEPSFWLLAFSFFIFLSLALLKRHSELGRLQRDGKEKTRGRGYTTADRLPVGIMGVNAAFVSLLIFILYFNSENVLMLYAHPVWLLGIIPLLVFWLGRLWTLSFRGEVNEDPVLYVSRDKVSLAVLGMCAALAIAASY
jgi:4-hydroxybenzoate polyprenyltransferase/phosphoserine phosphatase